jgi:hypothetical protein
VQHLLHQPLDKLKFLSLAEAVEQDLQAALAVAVVDQFYILNLFQYLPVLVVP